MIVMVSQTDAKCLPWIIVVTQVLFFKVLLPQTTNWDGGRIKHKTEL